MKSPYNSYFLQLFETVCKGSSVNEAPLAFTNRIHKAIEPYLRPEYQQPELPPIED